MWMIRRVTVSTNIATFRQILRESFNWMDMAFAQEKRVTAEKGGSGANGRYHRSYMMEHVMTLDGWASLPKTWDGTLLTVTRNPKI